MRIRLQPRRRLQGDDACNELASISVDATAAATDENASVENRLCQLRGKVPSTVLAVLGRALRQHRNLSNDNDVVISSLFAEKSRLHKAYVNRPTDENKAAF
nr:unnamed protein product [Spirometra erinaceieuropaei]